MVGQVADLVDRFPLVPLGARDDDLGGFLPHFFQDLFQPLVKQVAGVAAFLRVGLAALDSSYSPCQVNC